MARPRRHTDEALTFGRLVEAELQKQHKPGKPAKIEVAMAVVAKGDKGRWGKRAKWFRLWADYPALKRRAAEADKKLAMLRRHPLIRIDPRLKDLALPPGLGEALKPRRRR